MKDRVDVMVSRLLEDDPLEASQDKVAPLTDQEFEVLKLAVDKFKPAFGAAPDGSEPSHFIDAHTAYESNEITRESYESSGDKMYGFAMFSPSDRHAWVSKLAAGGFEVGAGGEDGPQTKSVPTLQAALKSLMPLFDEMYSEIQAEFGE